MTTQMINKVQGGNDLDSEDLRLLQTMIAMEDVQEPEPGDKVVQGGEAPMVRAKTKSAGYIHVRRNSDGNLVLISRNQIAERLKQRLPDGRPAWLPPNMPWTGRVVTPKFWCPLSLNHPDRPAMDEMNLPVCEKRGKLLNEAAVRLHLQRKHKLAWETIQRAQEQKREDAREARQSKLAEAVFSAITANSVLTLENAKKAGLEVPTVGEAGSIVADKAVAKAVENVASLADIVSLECDVCHETFTSTFKLAATNKLQAHQRAQHGKG